MLHIMAVVSVSDVVILGAAVFLRLWANRAFGSPERSEIDPVHWSGRSHAAEEQMDDYLFSFSTNRANP